MQDSFVALDARIDEKIARQANPSLTDIPSQAPVQPSFSHGQPDPSCLTPRMRYGHLKGERREPELEELTNVSPDMFLARILADAKAKGLKIPEGLSGTLAGGMCVEGMLKSRTAGVVASGDSAGVSLSGSMSCGSGRRVSVGWVVSGC